MHKCILRECISRKLILLVDKYKVNQSPKFIDFDNIKNEIENTISVIAGKIQIKVIDEMFYSLENLNFEGNKESMDFSNNQEEIPLDELKPNQEEFNIDTESIDNSILDLIVENNFSFSFNLEDMDIFSDEAYNYNSQEIENK